MQKKETTCTDIMLKVDAVFERLNELKSSLQKLDLAIFGNGKPGIKLDVANLTSDVKKLKFDMANHLLEIKRKEENDRKTAVTFWQWFLALIVALAASVTSVIDLFLH